MDTTTKNFLTDTFILLLNRACIITANVVVMILFSYSLQKELYGSFQAIWFQISIFGTIAGLGLSIYLFSYSFDKIRQLAISIPKNYYWRYGLFLLLICGIFIATSLISNQSMLPDTSSILAWSIYFLCFAFTLVGETLLIIAKRLKQVLFIAVFYTISYIFIAYLFAKDIITFNHYIIALGICILIKTIAIIYFLRQAFHTKQTVTLKIEELTISKAKQHWTQIGIFDILQFCFRNIDKLIVSYLLSKTMVATYLNATYEIPIFALLFASLQNTTLLQLNKKTISNAGIASITYQTNALLGLCITAIMSVLICYPATFLNFVFSAKYEDATLLFTIALLKMPCYWFNLNTVFQIKERGDILNKGLLIDILCTLSCMAILYPFMHIYGLLIATLIGTYIQTGYNIFQFKKITQAPILTFIPLRKWLNYILIYSLANSCLYYILQLCNSNQSWNMFIQGGIIGIASLVFIIKKYKQISY